jgi:hypothetical protein
VFSRIRSIDPRLLNLFIIEGIASIGATLLTVGIFFFTEDVFRWDLKRNFLLACGQGAVYVVGALGAKTVAARFGRRRALIAISVAVTLVTCMPLLNASALVVVAALLSYNVLMGAYWPLMESIVSSDADAHEMSRRLGAYNLVWAGTGALAVAVNGTIIHWWAPGVFMTAAVMHAVGAMMLALFVAPSESREDAGADADAHSEAEPELLAQRRLAMWLSRIALPATYMVLYAIAAMMPLLPSMQELATSTKTLVGSMWLVTRWVTFWVLGATVFWHTRPRLLLWAACAMLVAFLGVSVRPSDLFATDVPGWVDLSSMILWQGILGVALGMIYSGSLYFGMVLSEGSTEHGGYHEALIGLGSILGPGVGLLAMTVSSAGIRAGIGGVATLVGATVLAAAGASWYAGRARANGT